MIHLEHREALKREASALQTIAWTDALTGVPNRHFFTEALTRAGRDERRPEPQSILMIDIDHFRSSRRGRLPAPGRQSPAARSGASA